MGQDRSRPARMTPEAAREWRLGVMRDRAKVNPAALRKRVLENLEMNKRGQARQRKVVAMTTNVLAELPNVANEEAASKQETSTLLSTFKAAAKSETALFEASTDSRFYFVVCFLSMEQVEAFLEKTGWRRHRDEEFGAYLDGLALAKAMGVELPKVMLKFVDRQDKKRWSSLPAIRRVRS